MTSASVRDLRYRFPEIEARLRRGETIEIRKRKEVLGRLVPAVPAPAAPTAYPDFAAIQRQLWGGRKLKVSTTQILREERDSGN